MMTTFNRGWFAPFAAPSLCACVVALASSTAVASPPDVLARLGLARQPYIGVACPGADNTSCGRVGIAVWLQTDADEIDATIRHHHVHLKPPATRSPGGFWVGFVHLPLRTMGLPASWEGTPAKTLSVRLRIRRRAVWKRGTLSVGLSPGWG
jgi:hypothetical protein